MIDEESGSNVLDTSPKLTDWENEPTLEELKQNYTDAKEDHSLHLTKVTTWLDNLNITGSAKIDKKKGRSSIVPKLIRKQAEWRYPGLSEPFLSQESLFTAYPKTLADKEAARQNALILNHQFNTCIDKVEFIDEYVRTAVDEGTVIVRVGWNEEEALDINEPTVQICNIYNILIDPTCNGNLKKANFIIYAFETSLSELKKSGKYQNLGDIDLESSSVLSEPDYESTRVTNFTFKDSARKKLVAFEYWGYWDITGKSKTEAIVATWVGNVMIRMEKSPFPDKGLPFVVVKYLPVRNSNYGEPDGELLEDNQKIIGAVTRGMIDIMGRSAAGQKGIRADALDITNRRKFENGEDYQFNAHVDPSQAFYDHTYPEIPQSAQFMIEMQNMEAESLTGVKAWHSGISGEGLGSTATGAKGALDASGKREVAILRRLAAGIKEIGYKIIAMNGEFLKDKEIVRITDEEFIEINRENLKGRFDLALDISSAEVDNIKAQELAFMLQTVGNSMPLEMTQIILSDIAELRKMYDLSKAIKEYKPKPQQPSPLEMLELQKLQAEIAKIQVETEELKTKGVHNLSKAATEDVKSQFLQSQADMLDLDFVDKESGTSHARDMQKQGAQAQANMVMREREGELKDRNTLLQALTRPPKTPSATR